MCMKWLHISFRWYMCMMNVQTVFHAHLFLRFGYTYCSIRHAHSWIMHISDALIFWMHLPIWYVHLWGMCMHRRLAHSDIRLIFPLFYISCLLRTDLYAHTFLVCAHMSYVQAFEILHAHTACTYWYQSACPSVLCSCPMRAQLNAHTFLVCAHMSYVQASEILHAHSACTYWY